jgi:2-polyprenyl-3-methyl-5-hydroxy-6-metoxy-1,4-benzoquinol methylase
MSYHVSRHNLNIAAQKCPICDSAEYWRLTFNDMEQRRPVRGDDDYNWRLCTVCGNGYPSHEIGLDDLQNYWNLNRLVCDDGSESMEITWERRLRLSCYWADRSWEILQPFLPKKGRFLDIACGLGATVRKFQDFGWSAKGIDADPNTQVYHQKLSVDCVIEQYETVMDKEEKFDVISIAHAIYFIQHPSEFFIRVHNSLVPKGIFHVIISDFVSVFSDSLPSQVHTWFPTRTSLSFALEKFGFEVLETRKYGGSVLFVCRKSDSRRITGGGGACQRYVYIGSVGGSCVSGAR